MVAVGHQVESQESTRFLCQEDLAKCVKVAATGVFAFFSKQGNLTSFLVALDS